MKNAVWIDMEGTERSALGDFAMDRVVAVFEQRPFGLVVDSIHRDEADALSRAHLLRHAHQSTKAARVVGIKLTASGWRAQRGARQ